MSACKNSSCQCTFQTTGDVLSVVRAIETALQKDSMDYYSFQKYGYNLANTFLSSGRELYLYYRTLLRHYRNLVTCSETTLSCKSVSKLIKATNRIIDTMSCHKKETPVQEVDSSQMNTWVFTNPNCVSKERWESCVLGMIPKYTIEVKNFKELCELIVEMQVQLVNCDITAGTTIEYNDCNIEPKLYLELINCGLTTPIIKKAVDCGLTFRHLDGELGVVGVNGVKLTLKDITNLDTGCLV